MIQLIDSIFMIYMIMLFIRIIGSWFPEFQSHSIMRFIAYYTDPYLNFFRGIIPSLGMIDLSPIVAFFALQIIESIVKHLVASLLLS